MGRLDQFATGSAKQTRSLAMQAAAVADVTSLTLTESGQSGITLTLTTRALPYLPITIGGKQRAEFTWYPGSPQATVQMLGPEEDSITLNGFWKDRFIAGTGAAKIGASSAQNVQQLIQTVDTMRRMGRQITLAWGSISRIGHITSFSQTWHNIHDCEWEIEFSVISQESTNIAAGTPPGTNLASVAAQSDSLAFNTRAARFGRYAEVAAAGQDATLVSAFDARSAAFGISRPTDLNQLDQFRAALEEFDTQATVLASTLAGYAQQATALITLPGNTARDITSTLSGAITQTSAGIGTTVDAALTEVYALANIGGQDEAPFGVQLQASSYNRDFRNALRATIYFCAVTRYALNSQLRDDQVDVFVAPRDMDLRDVATIFYGTPDGWKDIMIYNGLSTSRLRAGQQIYVPRQTSSSGPDST